MPPRLLARAGTRRTPPGPCQWARAHARRAGLAANQIGVSLRAFAYNVDGQDGHLVNPVIEAIEGERVRLRLMADNRLSVRDRELFLAEPHVAALSVSAGPGRGPLTVPIWYQYAPGGEAWVLTEAGSRKARLIEAAGRFTLMVERVVPTVRYVSVEGPVTRTVPGTDELLREITMRYLPPEKVTAYIEFARADFGQQVAIYLRPQRWLSADLGPADGPPT